MFLLLRKGEIKCNKYIILFAIKIYNFTIFAVINVLKVNLQITKNVNSGYSGYFYNQYQYRL